MTTNTDRHPAHDLDPIHLMPNNPDTIPAPAGYRWGTFDEMTAWLTWGFKPEGAIVAPRFRAIPKREIVAHLAVPTDA